jgi:hypothetical protein
MNVVFKLFKNKYNGKLVVLNYDQQFVHEM